MAEDNVVKEKSSSRFSSLRSIWNAVVAAVRAVRRLLENLSLAKRIKQLIRMQQVQLQQVYESRNNPSLTTQISKSNFSTYYF